MAATRYWIVSLPVQNSHSSIWSRLQESISKQSFDTPLYRFNTPDLRVGTLDSLLSLSDDLLKSNSFIEGVSHKIRRQIEELERASGVESGALTVDGVPVDSYLTRFVWDEAKYPTMSPLREIVDGIHVQVAKIEDDLKVRVAENNNVRSQLNAINRKQSGSLAVRDLSSLVKPEDIITSEHLVTLLAVVPKYSQKDWLSRYETLTTYVVPRSSKKLHEDNEYALFTVTLFAKVADNFKTSARDKGFQIRDFEYSPEAQESQKQELERLMQDQETMRRSLLQWCYASYGEVFSSWMHFCRTSGLCCTRSGQIYTWSLWSRILCRQQSILAVSVWPTNCLSQVWMPSCIAILVLELPILNDRSTPTIPCTALARISYPNILFNWLNGKRSFLCMTGDIRARPQKKKLCCQLDWHGDQGCRAGSLHRFGTTAGYARRDALAYR